MGNIQDRIKTQPYLLSMSQIEVAGENLSTSNDKVIGKISKKLKNIEFNLVLPIACVTKEEGKYHLLTGIDIYKAAKVAGLKEFWVFLLAPSLSIESKEIFEQVLVLSKLNEVAIESEDSADFLAFLNTETEDKLRSFKIGLGPKTAPKIVKNRTYSSLNEVQEKFGAKKVLRWLRAYKQKY